MKTFIFSFVLIAVFALSGCTKSTAGNETHTKAQASPPVKKVSAGSKYQSITDYPGMITGENLKTGVLKITRNNNTLVFNMEYMLSDKLKKIMANTKNTFYLTFAEVDGQHKLDHIISEKPAPIKGNLNYVQSGPNLHMTQNMKLKKNAAPEEIKTALNPANYELVFLNESNQKVAVVIGLDLSTINP